MKLSEDILHYFDIKCFIFEYSIYAAPQCTCRIYSDFLLWLFFPEMHLLRDATEITAVCLSRNLPYLSMWSQKFHL